MKEMKAIGDLVPDVLANLLSKTKTEPEVNDTADTGAMVPPWEAQREPNPEYLPPSDTQITPISEPTTVVIEAEIEGDPPVIKPKDQPKSKKGGKVGKKKIVLGSRKMDLTVFPQDDDVWRANALCEAKLEMDNNLMSNKIFCTLIAKMDKDNYPNISFPTNQLEELFVEETGGSFYTRLKKSTKILSNTKITKIFFNKRGKEEGFSFENVFQSLKYHNGLIFGRFNDEMAPLLLNLKERFTVLNLKTLLNFESLYSQRMYEILSARKYQGTIEYDLKDLQDMVDFPQKLRNNFIHFRSRVLDRAKNEIEQLTDLKFDYYPIKSMGRAGKIVAIKFTIGTGEIDQRYKKYDKNFLFQENTPEYEFWKINPNQLVPYYKNQLIKFTKSIPTQEKLAFAAAKIGFDMKKCIEYCVKLYNSDKTRALNGTLNAYVIGSLKVILGLKTPPWAKKH
jgi:plasmid replication initiation protein